jgi:hypothetical protein
VTTRTLAVTVVLAVVFLTGAGVSLAAARCNWRTFRVNLRRAPLDGLADRITMQPPTTHAPHRWPLPASINAAAEAVGYATLAAERARNRAMLSELTLLTAGAALGGTLPLALHHEWGLYVSGAILLLGALALLLRERVAHYWRPLTDAYQTRYEALGERTAIPDDAKGRP